MSAFRDGWMESRLQWLADHSRRKREMVAEARSDVAVAERALDEARSALNYEESQMRLWGELETRTIREFWEKAPEFMRARYD